MAKRDASPQNMNQLNRSTYSAIQTKAASEDGPNNFLSVGTRVFKKSSPNSKITAYLGKRDFVDQLTHTEPIDGVILVDPEYVTGTLKVYASVLAAFRYGREDLDVLGLTFRKDLYLAVAQVYPPIPKENKPLTRLQERLIKKLGHNAYPFNFELPTMAPASVILQPAPNDTGKPCGVDYELKCFVSESLEEKPLKKSTVRLAIRKVMYAPEDAGPQPHVEVSRDFMMSPGPLHMEVTLDKKKYYHGEPISINVQIANNSNKTVKKIRISIRQHADICLFSTAQYKCTVAELESDDGFPLGPCCNLSKVYYLTPLLKDNRDKRGLALDGKLKHEDTNLASSTIFREERAKTGSHLNQDSTESSPLHSDNRAITDGGPAAHHQDNNKDAYRSKEKESLGIIVRYTVKVKLIVAFGQDVSAEVEFILTHPKPEPQEEPLVETANLVHDDKIAKDLIKQTPKVSNTPVTSVANLIELGDSSPKESEPKNASYDNLGMMINTNKQHAGEEDIIFEDFARLRLQGLIGGDREELDSTPTPQQQQQIL